MCDVYVFSVLYSEKAVWPSESAQLQEHRLPNAQVCHDNCQSPQTYSRNSFQNTCFLHKLKIASCVLVSRQTSQGDAFLFLHRRASSDVLPLMSDPNCYWGAVRRLQRNCNAHSCIFSTSWLSHKMLFQERSNRVKSVRGGKYLRDWTSLLKDF